MSYINFDKTQLVNLEYSLKRELIRSNRAGSFSCTTIIGCNTRKYHGLLVCPQPNLDGEKHVLLSKVDETLIQHDAEFNLGVNKFPGTYQPKGHKYIRDFSTDISPTISYRIGGMIFSKETVFVTKEERILIKYTLEEAHSPVTLRLRPFLAFRNIHRLSKRNFDLDTSYEEVRNGIRIRMYAGYSNLYMQLSKKDAQYVHMPDWYLDFEYPHESERGYEHHEDLYLPGYFEMPIRKGESITFSAGLSEVNPSSINLLFTTETKRRIPRSSFENCLTNAAEQFFYKQDNQMDIVAGFPWHGRLGRYTFISIPGLSMGIREKKICRTVIESMKAAMKGPFFPETGRGINSSFDAADTPLWFFWALQNCSPEGVSHTKLWRDHGVAMQLILESFAKGTPNGIKMRDNGLLYIDKSAPHLTWMNATVQGKPVTPRYGYVVEINALWYNALKFAASLEEKDSKLARRWNAISKKIEENFEMVFWNEDHECLNDFVADDHTDSSIRPNQILATSLPYTPLKEPLRHSIVEIVKQQLLTSRGLRTLSPQDILYKGRYQGNEHQRNQALHQGTVWPWLLGHFAEGYLKIFGPKGVPFIQELVDGFRDTLDEDGIGTISEFYEGDPPHGGRGAISFAPSVAEIIRIQHLLKSMTDQKEKKEPNTKKEKGKV
ncbi:MAG: amylo-alpha-1,6-glucosidase [Bacteroidales bacterium]